MAIKYNGTTIPDTGTIKYNGTSLTKVIYNGTTVWEKWSQKTGSYMTVGSKAFNRLANDVTYNGFRYRTYGIRDDGDYAYLNKAFDGNTSTSVSCRTDGNTGWIQVDFPTWIKPVEIYIKMDGRGWSSPAVLVGWSKDSSAWVELGTFNTPGSGQVEKTFTLSGNVEMSALKAYTTNTGDGISVWEFQVKKWYQKG